MSATTVQNTKRSFTASGAINQYDLVTLENDGLVSVAGAASTKLVGFADRTVATGESVTVCLLNGGGTAYGELAATVTNAGTPLYVAAGGEVSATASGKILGYTLANGGADGDIVEILVAPLSPTS